ncbi:hypothetical protein AYI69_g9183 [Smittium culicis]|uniref:Uncharacterized protein n=1 Tax=Smittium culicis TaxID=133412 RepID=A0A1R1XEE0_9FUNG|nr:hypothetical protein AYI69_g9183 [Smittium culicis]
MEQANEALAPASQDQVSALTKMVQQLLREREINQDPDDPYVTRRIYVTALTAYLELIDALTSIEEYFCNSPNTEEESKIAIHSCHKNSLMNYNPPSERICIKRDEEG